MTTPKLKPGWTRVKFGNVVRLVTDRCDPVVDGIERYIGLEHIEPEDLRIRRWGLVAEGVTFTNRFKPGQVLFGKRRAYQRKVAVADFEGVCSGDIYVFEPTDGRLLPELLSFICQTENFFEYAIKTSAGSLSPRTNWKSLADYEFTLPPLDEQRQILVVLESAHRLLESFRLLAQTSRIVYQTERETLLSASNQDGVRLGDLLQKIVPGKSVSGSSVPPGELELGVLKVSAVDPEGFLSSESKTLLDPVDFRLEFGVRKGDLLMTRANTADLVGETCVVDHDYPNLMLCDKTLRLEPASHVDTYLLWETLQVGGVRQQIKSIATGTGGAMKNISQPKIRGLMVAYPVSQHEAERISKALLRRREALFLIQRRNDETRGMHHVLTNQLLGPCN